MFWFVFVCYLDGLFLFWMINCLLFCYLLRFCFSIMYCFAEDCAACVINYHSLTGIKCP